MIHLAIPVHDEERTIGVLLWKVRRVMEEFGRDFRVLVLDDASTDRTPEVLERYRPFLPLEVVRVDERMGTTAAMDRLFRRIVEETRYPKRDVVVTFQADFTDDPEDLVGLVKTIEGGADVVVGTAEDAAEPPPLTGRIVRRLAPLVLGPAHRDAPVSDPFTGFRAYRVIVLKKALRERRGAPLAVRSGAAGNVELLGSVAPYARRIEESPVTPRPELRLRPSRVRHLATLKELFGLRRTLRWREGLAS